MKIVSKTNYRVEITFDLKPDVIYLADEQTILDGYGKQIVDAVYAHIAPYFHLTGVTQHHDEIAQCSFCLREWSVDADGFPECCTKAVYEHLGTLPEDAVCYGCLDLKSRCCCEK